MTNPNNLAVHFTVWSPEEKMQQNSLKLITLITGIIPAAHLMQQDKISLDRH